MAHLLKAHTCRYVPYCLICAPEIFRSPGKPVFRQILVGRGLQGFLKAAQTFRFAHIGTPRKAGKRNFPAVILLYVFQKVRHPPARHGSALPPLRDGDNPAQFRP